MSTEKIRSVTVLQSDEDFGGVPETLYGSSTKKKKKKKKKQSALLKPIEKMVFSMAKQYDKATFEYRDRHEKSNRKKKNGWIKDLNKNSNKALNKLGTGGLIGVPRLNNFKLFE